MLLIAIINQCVQPINTFRDHTAAASPITAIRATAWHMRLTPKAQTPGAAVAALNKDFRLIKKFHVAFQKKNASPIT
jgi:hypothetical protein